MNANPAESSATAPTAAAALAAFVSAEKDLQILNYLTVASLALLVYDSVITFPSEYKFIWRSKMSKGTFIYLFLRYGNLIQMGVNVIYYLWLDAPFNFCRAYYEFDAWSSMILVIPVTAVLAMRTYALFNQSRYALWIFISAPALQTLALLGCLVVATVQTKFVPIPIPHVSCVFTVAGVPRTAGIIQFTSAVAFEVFICLTTTHKALLFYRVGRTKLVGVILRDSLWYFSVLASLSVASLLLYLYVPPEHAALQGILTNPSRATSVVITCRIILNLRNLVGSTDVTFDTYTVPLSESDPSLDAPEGHDLRARGRVPSAIVYRNNPDTEELKMGEM